MPLRPDVRDGSFFPFLLDPRKRAERALVAVVKQAYVQGVSTRRVDDMPPSYATARPVRRQVGKCGIPLPAPPVRNAFPR